MKLPVLLLLAVGACGGDTLAQLPATALPRAAASVEALQSAYTAACEPFPTEEAFDAFCRQAYAALEVSHQVYDSLNSAAKGTVQ